MGRINQRPNYCFQVKSGRNEAHKYDKYKKTEQKRSAKLKQVHNNGELYRGTLSEKECITIISGICLGLKSELAERKEANPSSVGTFRSKNLFANLLNTTLCMYLLLGTAGASSPSSVPSYGPSAEGFVTPLSFPLAVSDDAVCFPRACTGSFGTFDMLDGSAHCDRYVSAATSNGFYQDGAVISSLDEASVSFTDEQAKNFRAITYIKGEQVYQLQNAQSASSSLMTLNFKNVDTGSKNTGTVFNPQGKSGVSVPVGYKGMTSIKDEKGKAVVGVGPDYLLLGKGSTHFMKRYTAYTTLTGEVPRIGSRPFSGVNPGHEGYSGKQVFGLINKVDTVDQQVFFQHIASNDRSTFSLGSISTGPQYATGLSQLTARLVDGRQFKIIASNRGSMTIDIPESHKDGDILITSDYLLLRNNNSTLAYPFSQLKATPSSTPTVSPSSVIESPSSEPVTTAAVEPSATSQARPTLEVVDDTEQGPSVFAYAAVGAGGASMCIVVTAVCVSLAKDKADANRADVQETVQVEEVDTADTNQVNIDVNQAV